SYYVVSHFYSFDSSIDVELLPPLRQFGNPEPDRAAHHPVMGNLLSLDVSIYQRRTDSKEPGGSFHVHGIFQCFVLRSFWARLGCQVVARYRTHSVVLS